MSFPLSLSPFSICSSLLFIYACPNVIILHLSYVHVIFLSLCGVQHVGCVHPLSFFRLPLLSSLFYENISLNFHYFTSISPIESPCLFSYILIVCLQCNVILHYSGHIRVIVVLRDIILWKHSKWEVDEVSTTDEVLFSVFICHI